MERDAGQRLGLTTYEQARFKVLERENFELRRANEILDAGDWRHFKRRAIWSLIIQELRQRALLQRERGGWLGALRV